MNFNAILGRLVAIVAITSVFSVGQVSLTASAYAQTSNSLGGASSGAPTSDDLKALGYNVYSVAGVTQILSDAGFTIIGQKPAPNFDGLAVVTSVSNQPFIFLFVSCQGDECLFLKIIHPIATGENGLKITPDMASSMTSMIPYGYYLSETNGNMTYRYGMPTIKNCMQDCFESQIQGFMAGAAATHQILSEVIANGRNTASYENSLEGQHNAEKSVNYTALEAAYQRELVRIESGVRVSAITGVKPFLAMRGFENSQIVQSDTWNFPTEHALSPRSDSFLERDFINSDTAGINSEIIEDIANPAISFEPLFPASAP